MVRHWAQDMAPADSSSMMGPPPVSDHMHHTNHMTSAVQIIYIYICIQLRYTGILKAQHYETMAGLLAQDMASAVTSGAWAPHLCLNKCITRIT